MRTLAVSKSSLNKVVLPFGAKRLSLANGQNSDQPFICIDGAPPSKSQALRAPRLLVLDDIFVKGFFDSGI